MGIEVDFVEGGEGPQEVEGAEVVEVSVDRVGCGRRHIQDALRILAWLLNEL